jgi:hypothetical protein
VRRELHRRGNEDREDASETTPEVKMEMKPKTKPNEENDMKIRIPKELGHGTLRG